MFDAHNHLDDARVGVAADDDLARARALGIRGYVVAGVDPAGWTRQSELASRHRDVHVTYGVHPWAAARAVDEVAVRADLDALGAALDASSLVPAVGLGELGLDRSRFVPADSMDRQRLAFREQLAMARSRNLPLVLHVLRAHDEVLRTLEVDGVPLSGGMVHSYSGSAELVGRYVRLGLAISFAGPVARTNARRQRAAAAAVPDEWLLAETDAPDQTPEAHRPARNEPAFLVEIVRALADARGQSVEHVAEITAVNARRIFRLDSIERVPRERHAETRQDDGDDGPSLPPE